MNPPAAHAGIDPALLQKYAKAGDVNAAPSNGKVLKMEDIKKLQEAESAILGDADDIEFTKLKSGVSYREFRSGKAASKEVTQGSMVIVQMTARCKKLSTAREPGGVLFYSTKTDTVNNAIQWTVGSGEILPGLEEAMIGMKRGAIRRIEVPSTLVFMARKDGNLPLPLEKNQDEFRRAQTLLKSDSTLIFEVLLEKVQ